MIKNLNFDLFDVINQVKKDKYGRVSAFLALNKPVGITSHDLVDQVRKKLGTRRVGHVGALDPAASGVMLVLAGKDFTRLSNDLMRLDKSYRVEILFGITTDTLDTEGKITSESDISSFDFKRAEKALMEFEGGYEQYVPVFSSVKVQGEKLRVLARKSKRFEIFEEENIKYVKFVGINSSEDLIIKLPKKKIEINNIVYLKGGLCSFKNCFGNDVNTVPLSLPVSSAKYPVMEIEFDCSKGTYVRQFAFDIAEKIEQVGMLKKLVRTRIGQIELENCIDIEDLKY